MSVLNINSNNLKIVENVGKKGTIDYSFLAEKGDVLQGTVNSDKKVVIDIDGEKITVEDKDASNSKVGDVKKYEVMESSKNKLVLKEIEENTGVNEKIDINSKINSKEMQLSYETQEIKQSLAKTNETLMSTEQQEQLADKLDKTVATLSPEDIRAIESEGKSIEEMDIQEIYNKVSKLKKEKKDNSQLNCGNVDKIVDNSQNGAINNDNTVDNIDNSMNDGDIVRKNAPKLGIIIENTNFKDKINEKIRIKLFDEPSPDALPEEVSHVVEELFDSEDSVVDGCITKDSIKYIMQNELDHTLDNIYKAKFAGSKVVTHNIADEDFEQLLEQVKDVIETAGYEVNDENIAVAKWIIECDIPFTPDTFAEYFELQEINKYTKEDFNIIVNDYIEDDVDISNMYISYVEKGEVEAVIGSVSTITDEAIEDVVKKDETINLANLLNSQRSIDEQLANNPNIVKNASKEDKTPRVKYLNIDKIMVNLDEIEQGRETEALTIKTRKQLEEIRLKLTLEAGNKLALKGFNIATEELSVVVEELTNIEIAYNNKYATALKDNYDGQKLYDETVTTVSEVKAMSGYVLAATYPIRDKITIAGLHEEGSKSDYRAYNEVEFKINRNLDRFNETFETIMTAPRADMGDSIKKAFRNVDEILEGMGLDITKFNQRAVRILGYNNTEITKENIASVKLYDYEVNKVLDELTPAATVELIKRGKNPLNMTLEELSGELVEIKASLINESDDNYSKYLWKLDKHQKLSAKERDAYIGIYRLIHQVEKSDGAVIGAIMNSGKELTLRNLLTEARVRQKKGINVNIDDLFGAVETVTRKGKTIDGQIEAAFSDNELQVNKKVLEDIAENITPTVMGNAIVDKVDIMNMPIEKVLQYIEDQEEKEEEIDQEYYEYKIKTISEIADNTSKAVQLLTGLGMETTMNNVLAASNTLMGNGMGSIVKKLAKLQDKDTEIPLDEGSVETVAEAKSSLLASAQDILNVLDERDRLNYTYTEIEHTVKSIVDAYKSNYENSEMDIEELRAINRNITFVSNMCKKECYEIPLITGESQGELNITNVNLTIIRNSNKHEVSVNFESQLLGRVEAKFTYKNNAFKGLILGDSSQGIELLKDNYEGFKQNALRENISIKQLDYGINNKINYTFSGKNNNVEDTTVSTKQLYGLSKALLMNIKATEEQILARG